MQAVVCDHPSVGDAAADRLVALALEQSRPVRDLCAEKFKDFQFGLKLIAQNTGQQEFTIDHDAVARSSKSLSSWSSCSAEPGASAAMPPGFWAR